MSPMGKCRYGIYPSCLASKPVSSKYTWHKLSSTIEYIPPPGPTGPTDISKFAYIRNCLAYNYRCFVQSQFSKNDLEAKQSWIYAVLLLSVGPVGPGGGIYSIIDYVVCKVYFLMDQVDHVICWPSENLTNDILTKWEVEQLGTWPRTSRPHPRDIYPWALSLNGSLF